MRINLTKQEIVNSIYMQIGYSKKISENLLEDFFDIIFQNLKNNNKVKIAKFGTFELRLKKSITRGLLYLDHLEEIYFFISQIIV